MGKGYFVDFSLQKYLIWRFLLEILSSFLIPHLKGDVFSVLIIRAALWSSGSRRNPLKVESRVRFPAGSPSKNKGLRQGLTNLKPFS